MTMTPAGTSSATERLMAASALAWLFQLFDDIHGAKAHFGGTAMSPVSFVNAAVMSYGSWPTKMQADRSGVVAGTVAGAVAPKYAVAPEDDAVARSGAAALPATRSTNLSTLTTALGSLRSK